MSAFISSTGLVFILTVLATFGVTLLARKHATGLEGKPLSEQRLSKWLIGLSAGATANSGFIVTAGVGLGYVYGLQWLLLPLAWLIGDIVFWTFFPKRINEYGERVGARTLTDIIAGGSSTKLASLTAILVGLIIVVCLTGYTSAQWLAGQKFVNGAFGIGATESLSLFAIVIIAYTAIGGFRGSIYADSLMAVVRVIGTVIALTAVTYVAVQQGASFTANIESAGPEFLNLFGMGGPLTIIGFVLGFAAASLGFGLGQPQIVSRYLAGRDGDETQAAWWIYIGFVQFTWIAMTIFGLLLRGVMPDIADPEAGLSIFFASNFGALLTGIIVADIFATIAATSNSLLVAMSQSLKFDFLERVAPSVKKVPLFVFTLVLGALSMIASLNSDGTVLNIAVTSVSLMGAGLAPAMIVKILDLRHTDLSIFLAILIGISAAIYWKFSGNSTMINEAAPGILVGLIVNYAFGFFGQSKDHATDDVV